MPVWPKFVKILEAKSNIIIFIIIIIFTSFFLIGQKMIKIVLH